MNDYADVYGQGTFNNIGYWDLFVTKFNASGSYQWSRNFGGPGTDKAHGLIVKTVDRPIVVGSFEKRVTWPVNALTITYDPFPTPYNVTSYVVNGAYCSDSWYGVYDGIKGLGFSDGFVAEAIDITRQPYDYYKRVGSTCSRPFVSGCIDSSFTFSCPDTITFCGPGLIYANTWTGSGIWGTYGPEFDFQWNTGYADTMYYKNIQSTNNYM